MCLGYLTVKLLRQVSQYPTLEMRGSPAAAQRREPVEARGRAVPGANVAQRRGASGPLNPRLPGMTMHTIISVEKLPG